MFLEHIGIIETHWKSELPVVVYRKPNTNEVISIFQHDSTLHHINDFSEKGFVFAPYNKKAPAVLISADKVYSHEYQIREYKFDTPDFGAISGDGREYHIEIVNRGIKEIKNNKFKKVVLSRKIVVPNNSSPIQIFRKVLDSYPDAFCYFWYHPKIGLWIGATPELLFLKQNSTLVTMSLAGTKKSTTPDKPSWGTKEKEEQDMVTQHIVQELRTYVPDLSIGKVNSVKAGNLWHLRTKIWGTVGDLELKSIIQALHPTPAICGFPVTEAEAFINRNENYDREFYTGFLGELNIDNGKTSHLFVNLRCMQIKEDSAFLYIGGGITANSNAQQEWIETVDKSETMLNMIFN
ncbi:MAG: isochorismate synthase [Eudoraea sp.]|uniref:isochorismate synthase n=1 Tax=Eudoraea sp. TaxID=1979955 RepID=UPI003C745103